MNSRPVAAIATFDEAVLSRGPREQHVSSDVEVDGERVFWNMARQPDGDKNRHAKVPRRPMPGGGLAWDT